MKALLCPCIDCVSKHLLERAAEEEYEAEERERMESKYGELPAEPEESEDDNES